MIFVLWIVMGATVTLALGMLIGRVGMAPAKVTGTVIIVFWLVWLTLGVGGYRSDPVAFEALLMQRQEPLIQLREPRCIWVEGERYCRKGWPQ